MSQNESHHDRWIDRHAATIIGLVLAGLFAIVVTAQVAC
jgi:hypothetical protein